MLLVFIDCSVLFYEFRFAGAIMKDFGLNIPPFSNFSRFISSPPPHFSPILLSAVLISTLHLEGISINFLSERNLRSAH